MPASLSAPGTETYPVVEAPGVRTAVGSGHGHVRLPTSEMVHVLATQDESGVPPIPNPATALTKLHMPTNGQGWTR
jgi:hypothetical protein